MRSLSRVYVAIAVVVFNTIMLFAIVNAVAALVLWRQDARAQATGPTTYERAWLIDGYGLDTLARNYPGMSRADLVTLLHETSNWYQAYEPFTIFRPQERHDRFITISAEGFRPVPGQAAWPPAPNAFNVFLFGGSTMMGAGVPDDQTIAAHMQRLVGTCRQPVHIYNFGRGFYFSTQERILFEQLLIAGYTPDAALFLDGLNDFYFADGIPQFTPELKAFFHQQNGEAVRPPSTPEAFFPLLRSLPAMRLATRHGLLSPPQSEPPMVQTRDGETAVESDEARLRRAIGRWQINRTMIRAIADASNVRVSFVWQPVPTYGYDVESLSVYNPGTDLFGAHRLSGLGYQVVADMQRRGQLGDDVLWLGDIQRNRNENLYVDAVHYTAAFSNEIARHLAQFARAKDLLPCGE